MRQTMGHRGPISGVSDGSGGWRLERERVLELHRRFWSALALNELVRERPLAQVAAAFGLPRGTLQSLQSLAATYCGMMYQLCVRLRWHEMAALFESLMPRMNFGISADVLPLCQIPGTYPHRARALCEAGLTTPEEVAVARKEVVEAVLRRLHQFESKCGDAEAARRQEVVVREAAQRIIRGAQDLVGAQLQLVEDEADEERLRNARAGGP
eukprot:CAMPEP_0117611432 /NCGR_PEP_ID=MMETSP0784-20121206/82389_1 /TAXON_ID=39447 /ORGANISM="" /LENGTH=211 /DNA_ID=CAMNT_0005414873 /DNA_START=1 /DNA_END=632 /DNA_ORIENTATION=+